MKDLDTVYAERIASEYTPKSTSKLVALKKLDHKAKLPATIFTYTFGIVGALAKMAKNVTITSGMSNCSSTTGVHSRNSPRESGRTLEGMV